MEAGKTGRHSSRDASADLDAILVGGTERTTTLVGMIKAGKKNEVVEFTVGECDTWVPIPRSLIESARDLGKKTCKDHVHPLVMLSLRRPEQGAEWFDLIGQILEAAAAAMTAMQAAAGSGGDEPSSNTPTTRMRRVPGGPHGGLSNTASCVACWIGTVDSGPEFCYKIGMCP